ncbi:hypothetical protein BEWA_005390 [Theileria equi strain WA]|uniref:FCP1 homology domain-containing protein n=1 Tax=Theileria equi strain WA TaxID=1537102 RepID=L0B1K3_THEEQ|nr:hypothetical protein BEWA_005390 [Theileria equi strain WA]AFZ81131.1 hypothetical protein BEWA_005390 [Theileria equi strain WA]|eukprot:XP_004830797.1 hypothetical protein BEWA_005390 [Theileria equi strain WA]
MITLAILSSAFSSTISCIYGVNYYAFGVCLFYVILKVIERSFSETSIYYNSSFLPKQFKHTYSLVLDLDETLIRSVRTRPNRSVPTIPVKINDKIAHFVVFKRPHLDTFLMEMRKIYEIVIYTASCQQYAEAILHHTCINHLVDRKLYRNDCIINDYGEFVKDLRKVRNDTSKVILIDNSLAAGSIFPENFIPIDSWFGGSYDTALLDIMPLLSALRNVKDVRLIINLRCMESKNEEIRDQNTTHNTLKQKSQSGPSHSVPPTYRYNPNINFSDGTEMNWHRIGERLNTKLKQIADSLGYQDHPNASHTGRSKSLLIFYARMNKGIIEDKIRLALSPSFLNIVDKSGGCGAAFDAVIVSTLFENKKLIERQRLVNASIAEEMAKIHAFTMKCHTPKEWEDKNKNLNKIE